MYGLTVNRSMSLSGHPSIINKIQLLITGMSFHVRIFQDILLSVNIFFSTLCVLNPFETFLIDGVRASCW